MKCFNCGTESADCLCAACRTEKNLDKVFNDIRFFNPETCSNPHLSEYAAGLSESQNIRECVPDMLALFPENIREYYFCVYYWMRIDEHFESASVNYLATQGFAEHKSQVLISYLLKKYSSSDYFKPRVYCDWIAEVADGISCELYLGAAEYFAKIAEYDLADRLTEKGLACDYLLYTDKEKMHEYFENQKTTIERYRTKKPYWPTTEEKRRIIALFYDEKGIAYPRISSKPPKIPESEFEPVAEFYGLPDDYCAFWSAPAFAIGSAKPIYQIAAVKVRNGKEVDSFQKYIRPQDGKVSRKNAADEAGVSLDVIERADDVDLVMPGFFEFVGDDVLVSTGALGQQAKLISRAARYTGMKRITNKFADLLDEAAETDGKFDLQNNNREFLLQYFEIPEGKDALEKAKANMLICEKLKTYE